MSLKPTPDLVREWDRRLKDSGFNDIESRRRDGECFSDNLNTQTFRGSDGDHWRAVSLYADWNLWASDKERAAWSMYADGLSIRSIRKGLKTSPNAIVAILQHHRARMTAHLDRLTEVLDEDWCEADRTAG